MSKYIKLEDVQKIFADENRPFNWTEVEAQAIWDFDFYKSQIESLPTYEYKAIKELPSRVEGKWMPIIEANEFGEAYQSGIYCSECGETLGCEANFCPNCGARMEADIK